MIPKQMRAATILAILVSVGSMVLADNQPMSAEQIEDCIVRLNSELANKVPESLQNFIRQTGIDIQALHVDETESKVEKNRKFAQQFWATSGTSAGSSKSTIDQLLPGCRVVSAQVEHIGSTYESCLAEIQVDESEKFANLIELVKAQAFCRMASNLLDGSLVTDSNKCFQEADHEFANKIPASIADFIEKSGVNLEAVVDHNLDVHELNQIADEEVRRHLDGKTDTSFENLLFDCQILANYVIDSQDKYDCLDNYRHIDFSNKNILRLFQAELFCMKAETILGENLN